MSLSVTLTESSPTEVFWQNITHNLITMADAAGLYDVLWRPEELGFLKAYELIPTLEAGLKRLKDSPEHYKKFNPENNCGSYEGLVAFVEKYLEACKENPDAYIEVSR